MIATASARSDVFVSRLGQDDSFPGTSEITSIVPRVKTVESTITSIPTEDPFHAISKSSEKSEYKIDDYLNLTSDDEDKSEAFDVVQQWNGHVLEVYEKTFLARMKTILGEDPDQEATIKFRAVDEEDFDLLEPGAFFYWSLGYMRRPNGVIRKHSDLRFRRLPIWREETREFAQMEAQSIRQLFSDD